MKALGFHSMDGHAARQTAGWAWWRFIMEKWESNISGMYGKEAVIIIKEEYQLKQFYSGLEALGITCSEKQIHQFLTFYEMLTEKNKVMNLTAITEFQDVIEKHFLDSLS